MFAKSGVLLLATIFYSLVVVTLTLARGFSNTLSRLTGT